MAENIKEIIENAKKELVALTGFPSPSAIGVEKKEGGYVVTIEVKEKKSIPESMDILGTYEVETDSKGKILGYERKELRKRVDTKVSMEEG